MRGKALLGSLIAVTFCGAAGAQGVITTVAGTDWVFQGDGKRALDAPLGALTGITIDSAGNPIIVDHDNCIVARIKPNGLLEVIAGNGIRENTGLGGPASSAAIYEPYTAVYDSTGNLVLTSNGHIRRVFNGLITAVAPETNIGPSGITTDPAGNIYFTEVGTHRVRMITPSGAVSTVAGNGTSGPGGDGGPATSAQLDMPYGVAFYRGDLYIADTNNFRIRKFTPGGSISTVTALDERPVSVSFDDTGTMYIGGSSAVHKVPPNSPTATVIAGRPGEQGYSGDGGPAKDARFRGPLRVTPDNRGNLFVVDEGTFRVRKISDGIITRIAGNGEYRYAGERVRALAAPLNKPHALAFHPSGPLYFSELDGNRVRKVSGGILETVAGTGVGSYYGEGGPGDGGQATDANISGAYGMVFDTSGNLYISEGTRIRKVTPEGIISTYAEGFTPRFLAFDSAGNLYATDQDYKHRVWKVSAEGQVTSYAGADGKEGGFSGDNGLAVNARLNMPNGLAVDPSGNVFVADTYNGRVRKITPGGIINTFVKIASPYALTFHEGNLYVGNDNEGLIYKVTPSGEASLFAGGGRSEQAGDGKLANKVPLGGPGGLVFDGAGNLYLTDLSSYRVRVVLAARPTMEVSPASLSFSAPSGGAPIMQTLDVEGSISGLEFEVGRDTGCTGGWLTVEGGAAASTPRVLTVTADPSDLLPGVCDATITITPEAALPARLPVKVRFNVGASLPPQLETDKLDLSFTFPKDAVSRSQTLRVLNAGGGPLNFTVSPITASWLNVSTLSGRVSPGKPLSVTVTADPTGLLAGTYTSILTIKSDDAGEKKIPVTATVSRESQAILLTQTGLSFTAVTEGGVVPPQSFGVVNLGSGSMKWTAKALPMARGDCLLAPVSGDWLEVTPVSGESNASETVPQVTVKIKTNNRLPPCKYYGRVLINALDAANTPHVVTISLEVLEAGDSKAVAVVQPAELVFYATPGMGDPGSQTVQVYNIEAEKKTFSASSSGYAIRYLAVPQDGEIDPSEPSRVIIQPLNVPQRGICTGTVTFQFSGGRMQNVRVTVISGPEAGDVSGNPPKARFAETGCVPTKLVPALTTLGSTFSVSAGWPVGLAAKVIDDCGMPLKSGRVIVTFSNGDPALSLTPLLDEEGTWQGTWSTKIDSKTQVTLTVGASNQLGIEGKSIISGQLRSPSEKPVITPGMVLSAAIPRPFQALAPGSYISIEGQRLAEAPKTSTAPWPDQLGATAVIIGDRLAPLYSVSENKILALVPFEINVNTAPQVLIARGQALSDPVTINMAEAQPSIFLKDGYPRIDVSRKGGPPVPLSPANPAQAGDELVIYCAGLGRTKEQVVDGAVGPEPAAKTSSDVTVKIGGIDAGPPSPAELSSKEVGVYLVRAITPLGLPPGDVSVTLTVAGQTSTDVRLIVR